MDVHLLPRRDGHYFLYSGEIQPKSTDPPAATDAPALNSARTPSAPTSATIGRPEPGARDMVEATGGVRFQCTDQDHTNRPVFSERTLPRPRPGRERDGTQEVVVTVAHGVVVRVLRWKLNLPPGAPGVRLARTTCVSHGLRLSRPADPTLRRWRVYNQCVFGVRSQT